MSNKSRQLGSPIPRATSLAISPRTLMLAGGLLLAGLATLAYLPAINGQPLLDDDLLVTQNTLVKSPNGLARIWFTSESIEYYPISYSSFWVEWRLWHANTLGYHLTNLTLHIAAAFLVWIVFTKLSFPGAFLAALLFAVHPVNVESVAWIAQRRNVLAMLFFLLTILAYLQDQRRWYWLSVLAFLLAMLSKGSVAILPLVLWLIAWWQTGRVTFRDVLLSLPFWAIAFVLTDVNIWFQTYALGEVVRSASFDQRLAGAGTVIWFYLTKALLPIDLSFIYPQWVIHSTNLLWWFPLAAAIIVTAILFWRRNSPQSAWVRPLLFAWAFFCIALLPVMGFAHIGFMKFSLVADHYQHIAILAVVALAAAGWMKWSQRHGSARRASFLVASIVVALLAGLSWHQSKLFADPFALYRDTLNKNPDCWLAHNNLAGMYYDKNQFQDSIEHSRQALRLRPDSVEPNYCLGLALTRSGRPQEAIEYYQKVLQLIPRSALGHNDLGIALAMTNRNAEAIEQFQQSLQLSPENAKAHNNIGLALLQLKQSEKAVSEFEHALKLSPHDPQTYANLAQAYADSSHPDQSRRAAQKAIELARAQGQMNLAQQLEEWLSTNQPEQSASKDAPSKGHANPSSP